MKEVLKVCVVVTLAIACGVQSVNAWRWQRVAMAWQERANESLAVTQRLLKVNASNECVIRNYEEAIVPALREADNSYLAKFEVCDAHELGEGGRTAIASKGRH